MNFIKGVGTLVLASCALVVFSTWSLFYMIAELGRDEP